jgi:FMN phosphatase YigB (HAD superfamily)
LLLGAEDGEKTEDKIWRKVLGYYGLDPEYCLAVGDDEEYDCRNPLRLGMAAALVSKDDPMQSWRKLHHTLTAIKTTKTVTATAAAPMVA